MDAIRSPASRGRGLKHEDNAGGISYVVSPASRGRGLKQLLSLMECSLQRSPASRGRGLKLLGCWADANGVGVARFTRAWIETDVDAQIGESVVGRPLHAGVD